MDMSRAEIGAYLSHVVWRAVTQDRWLLDQRSSERSIMFRIGHYLAKDIEPRLGRDWHVDVEYNRQGDQGVPKGALSLRRSSEDEARSVLPDLIIHRRGVRGRAANLLAVEAKKPECRGTEEDYDRKKLRAYLDEHDYQYAVLLKLGHAPMWEWINDDPLPAYLERPAAFRDA